MALKSGRGQNLEGVRYCLTWSSYRHNALGEENSLITEHELYLSLGESVASRNEKYKKIFEAPNSKSQELQVTEATMRGEVYGSSQFHYKIRQLDSRTTKLASHGGDRKSEYYKSQAG